MDNKNVGKEFEKTQSQLKIIYEINGISLSLNNVLWLRGGWAIDFLLGRITRTHSDVDFVSWIQYREPLEQALVCAGFQIIPVSEYQTDFLKNDVDVSIVFVKRSEEGSIIANGFPEWVWRSDALSTQFYNLQGVSVCVLNPHQLLEEKKTYELGTGRKLRSKDFESMKIIQQIIGAMD
ncbi:nucleotidyltransferase domain-containing protein [Viridibacillus sp. NPDC096237]|uniref:nucleotidyltransferase domain-containing protein n=1 Tax=Viridibacillus sp. NPDC096237 TaxID=3390721 RepID=UPI003D066573